MKSGLVLKRVKNLSSGTEILCHKKGKLFEVVELGDLNLVFLAHARPIKGNLLQLMGNIRLGGKSHSFEGTARVLEDSPKNGDLYAFKVQWSQIDKDLWIRLIHSLRKAQDHADAIFTAIRGGE